MSQLVQLSYVSSSKDLLSDKQLEDLLTNWRKTNEEYEVTGILLYKQGGFIQVIEGKESVIEQLFLNIQRDATHTGIIQLSKDLIPHRDFPDWSMGFKRVSSAQLDGFSDLLSSNAKPNLPPGLARTFLSSFK